MAVSNKAQELLRDADPAAALSALQDDVRKNPADVGLRVFLFELLAVLGQWDRAEKQLQVVREMGSSESLLMCLTYSQAIEAERRRADILSGNENPVVFGEPPQWMASLSQALSLVAIGDGESAASLRDAAFDQASAVSGEINGESFAWIADADMRFGPCLEAIVQGEYYFIPFERIAAIQADAPSNLRDLVWLPAEFTWSNGGTAIGLIPSRYPKTEKSDRGTVLMGRQTDWLEASGDYVFGLGQRMLATDKAEYPVFDLRTLELSVTKEAA